jgi:HD superfamily phosphohydrolase YqeK
MSQHTISLAGAMHGCPTAWQNFFARELAAGPRDHNSDITADYINQQLHQYQGRYVVDSGWGELQFESEADLNFFLLKFS